jgi:hypothetical protein
LAAWLAAPSDRQRLLALVSAAAVAPISGATIDRFSVDVLTALHQAEGVCFDGLRPALRAAALVTGFGPRLGLTPTAEERRDMEQLPFVVHVVDRDVVIEVCASVERRHGIGQPFYHQWAAGISAAAVVIDCHRVEHVNSVLIAWMLQVVQSAKPVPVQVRRARIQVMTQLRQLRLDHLMSIA